MRDACAIAKTGGTPEDTQARCLCYCQDGRDAQYTQARCLCYCQDGRDARRHTGKMPVLL